MKRAVIAYQEEKEKRPGEKQRGLRSICMEMETRCWQEDKEKITLDKQTLSCQLKGVCSLAETNAEHHSRFNNEEQEAIITYAINVAQRGFPLSPQHISEIANQILHAKDGDNYEPVRKK